MKRIIFLFILTIVMAAAQAQPPMPEGPDMPNRHMRHGQRHHRPPFDPAKFEKELEQFIVTEAALTPSESAKFFPVFREMRKKLMSYFSDSSVVRKIGRASCRERV